ncbi:MAG: cobalt ECF transporter T component CbiQ [Planctomycetes bacterium]|nr:cobalt ECF transporter T component CbiQ [Planctomycetota bacterium]
MIHRLPAGAKLAAAAALVMLVLLLPATNPFTLLFPAAFLVAVAALSRIPPAFLLRRLILLEPFVLGVALLALFQPGGWRLMLLLIARCTLCLLAMILLSNTTPFAELLRVLKSLHVPGLLISTLALMYRYLFVLLDEGQRMKRARASRTFAPKRRREWRTLATVVSQLFVRASERAERVYAAMCARGWQ